MECEQHARDLAEALERAGLGPARIVGKGVHWHVEVRRAARACLVHCFHYHREGAEYYHELSDEDRFVATGRTRVRDESVAMLLHWLIERVPFELLWPRFLFVDRSRRDATTLAAALDEGLVRLESPYRCAVTHFADRYETSANAGLRSCKLERTTVGIRAQFREYGSLLATAETDTVTIAVAVDRWLAGVVRATQLAVEQPAIRASELAPYYETGRHAEFRWREGIARGRSGDFVLTHHAPLLEALALDPIVSRFFFFTSLLSLCFSRCPDYPFSTDGLPSVMPAYRGAPWRATCGERTVEGSLEKISAFIIAVLVAEGDTTFAGSAENR